MIWSPRYHVCTQHVEQSELQNHAPTIGGKWPKLKNAVTTLQTCDTSYTLILMILLKHCNNYKLVIIVTITTAITTQRSASTDEAS